MDDAKLLEAINQAVVDKTMSLDGLNAIQELKARLKSSDEQLKVAQDSRDRYMKLLENEKSVTAAQNAQIEGLRNRVVDFEKREAQVTEALLVAKYAEYRRQDLFSLVQTIFKNPTIKQTISENETIPVAVQGGHGGSGYVSRENKNKTTTTITETE